MGVIKKNSIFSSSSAESLHLPESSDDDSGTTNNSTSQMHIPVPRRTANRHRVPVPMSFCSLRKCTGKKRFRRYENVHQLITLMEEDELGQVSIEDLIPTCNGRFTKLLEDDVSLQAWTSFVDSSEDVQNNIISNVRLETGLKKKNASVTKGCQVGDNAFHSIKTKFRNALKKNAPVGIIDYLEVDVVNFFSNSSSRIYISKPLNNYERLLLHAIADYYSMISRSLDNKEDKTRLVHIYNPRDHFQGPSQSLAEYLEGRKKGNKQL